MSAPRTVVAAGAMPQRIARLPRDRRGYPVPWFVAKIKGEWDFRITKPRAVLTAVEQSICWVCGQPLSPLGSAFVAGPMCAVNRTSAEPPSHVQCAIWAAKACPFLAEPHAQRRESNRPTGTVEPPGVALYRNPGVALVYPIVRASAYPVENGLLFDMGLPARRCRWFCESRPATFEEVKHSIDTGLPALMEVAEKHDGPEGVAELRRRVEFVLDVLAPSPVTGKVPPVETIGEA